MSWIFPSGLVLLLLAQMIASFADRIYTESSRFLARDEGEVLESWERLVEPKLRLSRESAASSASVLRQVCFGALALTLTLHSQIWVSGMRFGTVALVAFELLLVAVVFDRLIPQIAWSRVHGEWLQRIALPVSVLFYLVLPITLGIGLVLSIAGLAEPEEGESERPQREAVDALLEAGEEEGILERSDRELVRSVVEFGDMVVREVMTPRPEIVAAPGTLTLDAFTALVNESNLSRVPVYGDSLDDVTGIAFARDLLGISDAAAATRRLTSVQRPVVCIPEMKKVAELLKEMQKGKQHMSLVIDEYGGVAGLVTIEDLLEAIVGEIEDEHDAAEAADEPIEEADGAFVLPGGFDVARLPELLAPEPAVGSGEDGRAGAPGERRDGAAEDAHAAQEFQNEGTEAAELAGWLQAFDSTTVGGLVSEIAGHIPLPGEVVEEGPLRIEVLASTDRLVERVRVAHRQLWDESDLE